MFEAIFSIVFEITLCLMSIAIYTFVTGSALPSLLLRFKCSVHDRGIHKYTYPEGRGVRYEPHPDIRKYVSSYLLFVNDGAKYIKCEVASDVERIEYSAVVFDARNRIIDVVCVKDSIGAAGRSKSVMLPMETSYVSFLLSSVNGKKTENRATLTFDKVRAAIFAASVLVLTVAEAFILRGVVLRGAQMLREYFFAVPEFTVNGAMVFFASLIIGATGVGAMFLKKSKGGLRVK